MKSRFLVVKISVCMLGVAAITPTFGAIIASGPENLKIQGVPGTIQSLTINLAGDPGSWDTLQLTVGSTTVYSDGFNDIYPTAGVALAGTAGYFPAVTEYEASDPYPSNPEFGSGSEILWSPYTIGGFSNGTGYAAVLFGTQGGGPAYSGWIQLTILNLGLPTALITVDGWAYSDVVGQSTSMGQVATPEPSTISMLAFSLAIATALYGRRARVARNSARP